MSRKTERWFCGIIRTFLLVILFILAEMSMTGTCAVYGVKEKTQYLADFLPLHLVVLLALVLIFAFRDRNRSKMPAPPQTERKGPGTADVIIILIVFFAGLLWMAVVPSYAGSDSRISMKVAGEFLNGDYRAFEKALFRYGNDTSGYVWTYPNQTGLILYMALLIRIFGEAFAPMVFRILNLGFLLLGTWCMTDFFGGGRKVWGLLLLFLPFSFYYLFVYGTVPGFGLSMLALWAAKHFLKEYRLRWLLIAAFSMACGVLLKNNYLIVFVALEIWLVGEAILRRDFRPVLGAALIFAVTLGLSRGVQLCISKITGCPVGGIPSLAWIEMGLQTGSRANGWYNGYNVSVFRDNGADPARTAVAIRRDLAATLADMKADPAAAFDFFREKVRSEWTDPTFQSLWIQQITGQSEIPFLTDSLWEQGGALNVLYTGIYNIALSLIYAGAFLNFLLDQFRKKEPAGAFAGLIPAVIFIGGFLFHLVWEAKSQYTVVYVLLLIPYAVQGLRKTGRALARAKARSDRE